MKDKIAKNIKGLNLLHEKGNIRELLEIARDIFPEHRFNTATSYKNCNFKLVWNKNLSELFENSGFLGNEERLSYVMDIADPVTRTHQLLDFLVYLLDCEETGFAGRVIEQLKRMDESGNYQAENALILGYRILLKYHAEAADLDSFLSVLRLSESREKPGAIEALKTLFISHYVRNHCLEDSLRIAGRKEFGSTYLYAVLYPYTRQLSYRSMKKLIDDGYSFRDMPPAERTGILALTFANEAKICFSQTDFEDVLQLVEDVDHNLRVSGDVRLRDHLMRLIGTGEKRTEYWRECGNSVS